MDVSETYIKMCGKAEEIQAIWLTLEDANGSWFKIKEDLYGESELSPMPVIGHGVSLVKGIYVTGDLIDFSDSYLCDGRFSINNRSLTIWLPRQDQLQILSGLSWYLFDKTCVTWATTNPDYQRESKEILGLRVVMHTIHKKQWIDNKWILDKTIP